MALIGSISGSNGTQVTGSLLVSNNIEVNGGQITSTQANTSVFTTSTGLITLGASTSTGSFSGELTVTGRTELAGVIERVSGSVGGTGTVSFNILQQSVFYVNGPVGNITANFTSVPTTANRVLTPTIVLSQSATARIVSAITVDGGASQTISWANGVTPTGTANKHDVFGFSLIRSGSAWVVLGQMSTYG